MKLVLLGLAFAALTVIPTPEVHAATAAAAKTNKKPAKTSWYREKYLQQTYDDYYEYTLNRYRLEDNDIDMCPDFEKSASIFAITSQQIYRVSKTCNIYVTKAPEPDPSYVNYTPPDSYYKKIMNVTVMDVVHFVHEFACYTFEIGMLIMSLVFLCCSTIFMGILLFCQY